MAEIRRPLAITGFTFFITGSIALSMPGEYTVILLALFAVFTIIHRFTVKKYTKHLVLMLASAVAAVVYISVYSHCFEQKIQSLSTEQSEYTGYINSITNNENTGYTVMLLDEQGREMYGVSIYYHGDFELGDKVKINGKFSENYNNQYIFSNYSKGILGKITAKSMELADVEINTVKYKTLTLRRELLKQAERLYTGDYLALVASMGYSDKHFVSDSVNQKFKTAGISHALVVSGFHVGIIVYMLLCLMRFVPINKKIKNIAVAAVIIVFMYIIGLTPSVIRAGLLAAVILIASNYTIKQDSLTTLALIGLVCIVINPYITRDIGAMLSYSAAAGLIITNDYCKKREIEGLKNMLLCMTAAVLFTMPVLALAGMRVTLLSPIFNLILTLPVSMICVLSTITPMLGFIPCLSVINSVLVATNTYICATLLAFIDIIERHFDFALINLSAPIFLVTAFAALAAVFVVSFQTENKKLRKIFVVAVSILTALCYNLLNNNVVTVTAFDSGRETSFHISAKGSEYLVLSEWMTQSDAKDRLISANGRKYEHIYYCPKEFKYYTDYTDISKQVTEVSVTEAYNNDIFTLKSDISGSKKLFTFSVKDCDIQFAHGKVTAAGAEYYFLGNDKPKSVAADEIYIFGNIPTWMEVEDIIQISSDLKIKINLKTGEYKTVKDVFNFGY